MNKIYLIFIAIIAIPFVSSISTTMLPTYQPGETMIIEIQGNILEPIDRTDVVFKRAHVAIAVDYDVKRISNKYYLYAQLPTSKNNYTLYLNDISTTINGQAQTLDYNQTFQVEGNLTEYSINPGFIIANQDFSLTLNSNLDQETTININFPVERAVNLQPGTNTIQFSISSIQEGFYLASIGKYIVPIQITNQQTTSSKTLIVSPKIIREVLETGNIKSYDITITNSGNEKIIDLYFIYDQEIFSLNKEIISTIEPNKSESLVVTLKKVDNPIIESIIIASGSEELGNVSFNLTFTNNQSEITDSSNPQYYCSELSGRFCAAAETCSTQIIQALDGQCCTGICTVEQDSTYSWVLYTLSALVIVVVFIMYMRYRKTKLPKPKSLDISSILKKST